VLLDEHNIESDYHRRRALQARSPRLAIEYLGWRRFERSIWQRVDGVCAVCSRDARAVAGVVGAPALIAENAIDGSRHAFRLPSERRGHQVLFVGHLSYEPNVQAAVYLARQVLPRLLRLVPEACLVLAGRCPMPELHTLAGPRVLVLGDVDSIESLYEQSAACALPISLGAGTSLKVLEVLQTGVPLIATEFAVRGFDLVPGTHYQRAENAEEFARALAAVLTERASFDGMAQRGLAQCRAYTWERSAGRFAAWVRGAIHRTAHREDVSSRY
jgi:glycosyltransferase involved in cell wall biosynthesis